MIVLGGTSGRVNHAIGQPAMIVLGGTSGRAKHAIEHQARPSAGPQPGDSFRNPP
jgi:hypothetical protein